MNISQFLSLIDGKCIFCIQVLDEKYSKHYGYNSTDQIICQCGKFCIATEYNYLVFLEVDVDNTTIITLRDNDLEINNIVFYSSNNINNLVNKFLYFVKNNLKLKEYLALL